VESSLYALRTAVARRMRWFLDHVSVFIALSEFSKHQLVSAGFPAERIAVRPNMVNPLSLETAAAGAGEYVAYAGRITFEKGVDLLCEAANRTNLPLRIAGDISGWPALQSQYADRVRFEGMLRGDALVSFYGNARFVVVPSRWWEVCPLVVLEAMHLGIPVLASRIGGLPEMVEDGVNGLLFEPDNRNDLADKMQRLWNDAALRRRLIEAGRRRIQEKYAAAPYFSDLMSIYSRAMENGVGTDGPPLEA
jgi:glycosyltransferase involved in cell wall biosynthesis